MSAAKFEKNLAALERRLRDEFKMEISSLAQRVHELEDHLRRGGRTAQKEEVPSSFEVQEEMPLPGLLPQTGSTLSAVLPEKEDALAAASDPHKPADERRMRVRASIVEPDEDHEEDEEPIPFAETVWNVALVLGFTGAGWLDIVLTLLLAVLSTFMQILFVIILMSPGFLGSPFESEIAIARSWRASIAHDSKYKDLSDTSLASRVCNGDGSLIQSTVQANLLREIDNFLGILNVGDFEPPGSLQPGTLLSGLCILLWCIYLCKEFRAIWVSVEAALQIPRAHVTIFKTGRFVTISWHRLGVYLTLRLARTAVAGCLLYAGIQWLARTTNIADLILNAVALGAILEIDEMIFASLLPKKVQVAIYELEAISVTYTRSKSQLEGLFIFILVTTLSLIPFFVWVLPLGEAMVAVKKEYCEGNQDFAMAFNEDQQVPMGFNTVPFANASFVTSLGEMAVAAHARGELETGDVAKYMVFAPDADTFASNLLNSMEDAATRFPFCTDKDDWVTLHGSQLLAGYGPHFRAAAAGFNRPEAETCAELADKCEEPNSRLLRLVCGRTCKCHEPLSYPWFKVQQQGCSAACQAVATTTANERPCEDMPVSADWLRFWDNYAAIMSLYIGQDLLSTPEGPLFLTFMDFMKEMGCLGIAILGENDPVSKASWCEGNDRYWSPLAHICPVSCSCPATDKSYCPTSCRACGDAAEFPTNGAVTNCAEAKSAGICNVPSDAEAYCAGTCGLCSNNNTATLNETNASASSACMDQPLLPELGLHNCSFVQERGWCPLLTLVQSPVSKLCAVSCGSCS